MRSSKVMELYTKTYSTSKKRKPTTDSLYENYLVDAGWKALEGYHHSSRMPDPRKVKKVGDPRIFELRSSGIRDLKSWHKNYRKEEDWQWLKQSILSDNPKDLYLQIDASYPTHKILSALRKLISQQKIQINNSPDDSEWFGPQYVTKEIQENFISQIPEHIKRKFPDIKISLWQKPKTIIEFDVSTWIDYFRCYDLRRCEGKSFGEIALQVYGNSNKRDFAKKGYDRVSILIPYAETHNWPPPANFLNPK